MERLFGYGIQSEPIYKTILKDKRIIATMQEEQPNLFMAQPAKVPDTVILKKVLESVERAGFGKGISLRHLSVPGFGMILNWLPQIIGSCVASGAMRAVVYRTMAEVYLYGEPETLLGRLLKGNLNNVAPFAPYHYGCGRRRGNLRGGDGSFCGAQIDALSLDGVLLCNAPGLADIVGTREIDYPEPQGSNGARIYRDFGNWKYLDQFSTEARKIKLLETEVITSADRALVCIEAELKPMMICSDWAFMPSGKHKDGFTIYVRNTRDSWAHNMTVTGVRITSNGQIFIEITNSWGPNAHEDGEVFYIPVEVFARWLPSANCATIGNLDLPDQELAPDLFALAV